MLRTTALMGLMTALLVFLGDYLGGSSGMSLMLLVSLAMNFFMYWYSDTMVIHQYGCVPVTRNEAPELYDIVEKLAARASLPMPKVYVMNSRVPNAFATGRNPQHAAVCVTTGLMDALTAPEIAGVLGHEMSHILHRDILVGTIAAVMAGTISALTRFAFWFGGGRDRDRQNPIASLLILILTPLMAMIIQLAISRTREYMADEAGAPCAVTPMNWQMPWKKSTLPPIVPLWLGLRKVQPICSSFLPLQEKRQRASFPLTRQRKTASAGCASRRKGWGRGSVLCNSFYSAQKSG